MPAFFPRHPPHPRLNASQGGWVDGGDWVVIQAVKRPEYTVSCLLDEEGARMTSQGANWDVIPRPRGTGLLEWQGRQNYAQDVSIIMEGWNYGNVLGQREMGHYIGLLEGMTEYGLVIRLFGPVLKAERHWVIETLEYGEVIRQPNTGRRVRQHMTLKLIEYVQGEELQKLPRGSATATRSLPKTRTYVLLIADDLQKIAMRMLGRAGRWPEIEALNPPMRGVKLDPVRFPAGSRIRIPDV